MSKCQRETKAGFRSRQKVSTYFAPPERLSGDEIAAQMERILQQEMLVTAFDAVPITMVILNGHRQIIGANSLTKSQFGDNIRTVLGKRPGEAFGCVYAPSGPGGCGTSKACVTCGAVQTILHSYKTGERATGECCLESVGQDGTIHCLELKITVSPFKIDEETYYSLILEDNSQNKRVEVFQRLFFHDVLNTIGCIMGYVDILLEDDCACDQELYGEPDNECISLLAGLCEQLHDEVSAHRQLICAENSDLAVQPVAIPPQELLKALATHYQKHEIGQGHILTVLPSTERLVVSDRLLLMRVLGNMTKNAIEACPPGSTITLSAIEDGENITFSVNNPGVIPEKVRYQIFKRSFSTKQNVGRGIGTYSMRLLGEKYLGGKVDFLSDDETGTTFRITIPITNHEAS
ncbi:MAG: sensor histidine kinase [Planctomycetaceae bacterium]|nr:sensor histidine kinase [Planctomycetaceae bacterium]